MKLSPKRISAGVASATLTLVLTAPLSTVAAQAADTAELDCNGSISASCPVFGGVTAGYSTQQPAATATWGAATVAVKGEAAKTAKPGEKVTFTYEVTIPLMHNAEGAATKLSFDLWQKGQFSFSARNVTGKIVDKGTEVAGSSQKSFKEVATCAPAVVVPTSGDHVTLTCDIPADKAAEAFYFVAERTGEWGGENYGYFRLDSQTRPQPGEASTAEVADPKVAVTVPEGFEVSAVTGAREGDTWKGTFEVTLTAAEAAGTAVTTTPTVTVDEQPVANVAEVKVTTVDASKPEEGEGNGNTGDKDKQPGNTDETSDKDKQPGNTDETKDEADKTDPAAGKDKQGTPSGTPKTDVNKSDKSAAQAAKPAQNQDMLAVTGVDTGVLTVLALGLAASGIAVGRRRKQA